MESISKLRQRVLTFIVITMFLVVIVFWGWIQFRIGVYGFGDTSFHIARIYEIREAFLSHQIPIWLNFLTFSQMGQAINGMYPDISLWPFVLVTSWLPLVEQVVAIRILIVLMTFIVTAISLYRHRYLLNTSLLIAIIYSLSGYSLYQAVTEFQPNTGIIYIFSFPIFYIIRDLLSQSRLEWPLAVQAALLFSIVMYSHVLSAIVLCIIVAIILLYKWLIKGDLKKVVLLNIMTMGAFVLLFSLPIVYRYLIISRSGISTPYSKGAVDSIHLLLNPEMQQFSIGWMSRTNILLVSLGLMFLTLIFLKKDQNQYKLLVIEALLIIMCTNLFPWHLFQKLPILGLFQYAPWRFGICLNVIPIILFLDNFKEANPTKWFVMFAMALLSLSAAVQCVIETKDVGVYGGTAGTPVGSMVKIDIPLVLNNIVRDYAPKQVALGITNQLKPSAEKRVQNPQILSGSEKVNVEKRAITNNNGIKLTSRKTISGEDISLPIFGYSSLKYEVLVNNKPVSYEIKDGYIALRGKTLIKKGQNVKVIFKNPSLYNWSLVVSLGTFIIATIFLLVRRLKQNDFVREV